MPEPSHKRHEPVRAPASEPALSESLGVDRRTFFKGLAERSLDVATAGIAGLSLAPAAGGAAIFVGMNLQDVINDNASPELLKEFNSKNVDLSIPVKGGGSVDIIGLNHITNCYEDAKDSLEPRIKRADIVLHELGDWFTKTIGDPARARGQMVGTIEGEFTQGKAALFFIGSFCYLVIKSLDQLKAGIRYLSRALFGKANETISRRAVVSNGVKMLGAVYVGGPTVPLVADLSGRESLMVYDVSPISDGRTVKMLDNAFRCAEKHPGKRIAVVVGNGHARGMKLFLSDPDSQRIFTMKRSAYNVLQLNGVDFRWRDKSTPGLL